jgi:basic membrane protein A and related proteins
MKKKILVLLSVMLVLTMVLSACQQATPVATEAAPTAAAAATEAPAAAATEAPATVYKLAVVFPGVITDADYNTLAYIGMTEVQRTLGVETAYSESVAVPDVDRVMREYIDSGYNIIWSHGGQFVTQTVALAKEFPKVEFIAEGDANVKDPPANLWFIDRNFQNGYYAIGTIAALATKSGKIGYMGGSTLAFSYQEVHAIQQALTDMGSKAQLVINYTGDFNDPTKARQAADAMISSGVDVIMCSVNLGVLGVFEAAKNAGESGKTVLVTAKYTDKSSFAPKNYITSVIYDFAKPLEDIVTKIKAGETGGYYPLGFDTGVSIKLPLTNVDESVQTKAQEVIKKVMDGSIKVVEDSSEVK